MNHSTSTAYPFLDAPQEPEELGRLGSFRILRLLGQGGMGIVFEGEDTALGRRVAIKVLRPGQTDSSLLQRFHEEARLAASLRHDHIVSIYQIGQHGDQPYLVMEYLTGESLAQRLERDGWLPVGEALKIAREVAQGLQAAHEHGLIHRDIKPANIWLESDQPGGSFRRVKILDFGLARPIRNHEGLTKHGELVGTPGFMAPEQIYGGPLDGRTDLYSLGSMLYASLTGSAPFVKNDTMAMLEAVVGEEAPDLRQLNPRMPRQVGALIAELLNKDPDQRPANAATVVERLRALEAGDTLVMPQAVKTEVIKVAGPVGRPARQRVHPGVWAGAATILLAAIVGIVMGIKAFQGPRNPQTIEPEPATTAGAAKGPPIKIGVLHSLSGTFAGSERPMVDAIVLAVEEINKAGGVLGRDIEPIVADSHSDAQTAAEEAERLLTKEQVVTLFGCWSSSSRKQVAAVCQKHDNLLVYSIYYEGLEQSPHVVYVGGAPNQQLQPTAKYAYADLHKRKFFLVGSDYIYSRAANEILKDELEKLGGKVVGMGYEPLESTSFGSIVEQIKQAEADMVMNSIDGSSNTAFFQAMRQAGLRPDKIPIMWLSIGEEDLASLPQKELVGDFISLPYLQSIEGSANEAFLKRFRARYPTRRVGDAAEAAYSAVYLWKQAVEKSGSVVPIAIREALRDQRFDAPEGQIRIDPRNLHAWRMARIARIDPKHQFEIVYTSPRPLPPEPFPPSRTREEWEALLQKLYNGWGQRWEGPRR